MSDKKNPFIVRLNVKDRDGRWRKVSLSPVLFSAVAELGQRQKMPVTGAQIVQNIASRLHPSEAKKSGFSRLVQEELIYCLLELLGGDELKEAVFQRKRQAELKFD